jgi:hypothetical protein
MALGKLKKHTIISFLNIAFWLYIASRKKKG